MLSSVTLVAKVFNRCIGKQVLSKVIWEERIALTQLRKRVPTPIVYNGTLQIHPKLPKLLIPPQRSPPNLIHPSLDRPHSPSQTASTSNQPFCHSTLSGPTDKQTHTDRWARQQVYTISAYARYIDRERRANNLG